MIGARISTYLLALSILVFFVAYAGDTPKQGADYLVTRGHVPKPQQGKIEVVEFFSYYCGRCYLLEPHLGRWTQRRGRQVAVERVPVSISDETRIHQRMYFALEAIDALSLHAMFFRSVQEQGTRMANLDDISGWVERQGVDKGKFIAAYHSPHVEQRVQWAIEMMMMHDVDSLPVVAVDGRFVTSLWMAHGDVEKLLQITDYLVDQAQQRRASRSAGEAR